MRDDVVELAGDPRPLLGHRDPCGGLALPLGLGRAHLRSLCLLGALPQGVAGEPADPEEERDEEELAWTRVRAVVHDYRRAAEDQGQADPRLDGVAEVAEQERGRQADGGDARRERDQPPVHERERRAQHPDGGGRAEWEAAAREQRQHDERGRRDGEPQRRGRGVRVVAAEGDPEHPGDRGDHDQGVESVPADEQRELPHAVNVLHGFAGCLLPE